MLAIDLSASYRDIEDPFHLSLLDFSTIWAESEKDFDPFFWHCFFSCIPTKIQGAWLERQDVKTCSDKYSIKITLESIIHVEDVFLQFLIKTHVFISSVIIDLPKQSWCRLKIISENNEENFHGTLDDMEKKIMATIDTEYKKQKSGFVLSDFIALMKALKCDGGIIAPCSRKQPKGAIDWLNGSWVHSPYRPRVDGYSR